MSKNIEYSKKRLNKDKIEADFEKEDRKSVSFKILEKTEIENLEVKLNDPGHQMKEKKCFDLKNYIYNSYFQSPINYENKNKNRESSIETTSSTSTFSIESTSTSTLSSIKASSPSIETSASKKVENLEMYEKPIVYRYRFEENDYYRMYKHYHMNNPPRNTIFELRYQERDFIKKQIELNNIRNDIVVYEQETCGYFINEYPVDLESFKNDTYLNNQKKTIKDDDEEVKYEFELQTEDFLRVSDYYEEKNMNYIGEELLDKRINNREYLKDQIDKNIIQKNILVREIKNGRTNMEYSVNLKNFKKDIYNKEQEKLKYKFSLRWEDCKRVMYDFPRYLSRNYTNLNILYDKIDNPIYLKEQIEKKTIQNEITVFELDDSGEVLKSFYVRPDGFKIETYQTKQDTQSKNDIRYSYSLSSREDFIRVKSYHLKYITRSKLDKFEYKMNSSEFIKHQIDQQNIQNDIIVKIDQNSGSETFRVSPQNFKIDKYRPSFKMKVKKVFKSLFID
mmetsp:Transcript_1351/g.2025  ORF Transcript_1351/g.2025 Transcript_1351/m.2025 type:complete len:507 (+) Transcript_1351:37-1557(+)